MPSFVILLILFSASIHVSWNALVKGRQDKLAFAWLTSVSSLILMTPLFIWSRLSQTPGHIDAGIVRLAALSGFFEACYMVLLYSAYRHADLSVVYPVSRGTAPVITALVGWFYVADRVSLPGGVAVCAVIAGVAIVARSGVTPRNHRTDRLGVTLAILTGLMIAGYQLVDRRAMTLDQAPSALEFLCLIHVAIAVLLTGAVVAGMTTWTRIRQEFRRGPAGVVCVSIGIPLAFYFIIVASKHANVTYITAARNIGIVISTAVGAVVFREKVTRARLAGAAAVVAGVIGLALIKG